MLANVTPCVLRAAKVVSLVFRASCALWGVAVGVIPAWAHAQRAPSPASTETEPGDAASGDDAVAVVRGGRARSASEHEFSLPRYRAVPRSSAAELLTLAPGLHLAQHGGEGKAHQLFLRGFDAQHGQDVEFSVGGLRVNDVSNVHGQGYADLNFLIPEVVDRLRVQEGPYDPRQGDFAVAGSARFDLGVEERGLLFRGSYGQFDTTRLVLVAAPRGMHRGTFAAAELYRTEGYGQNRAAARASALGQYVHPLRDGATLRVLGGSYAARFDSPGVVRADDLSAGRQGFFDTYDTLQGGAAARHFLLAEVTLPQGANRTVFSAFVSSRTFSVRENFTGFAIHPQGDRYLQRYEAATAGLEATHRGRFVLGGYAQSWEVGVQARYDDTVQAMDRQRGDDTIAHTAVVDADVRATDIAMFGDLALRPTRRVLVRSGVRADGLWYDIDDRIPRTGSTVPRGRRNAQGIAFGPRASVEVDLGRGVHLTAAFGRGFRSPQALSLGEGEQAPFATVHAGELGARWQRRGINATATGFVTHVNRDLVFEPTQGTNLVNPTSAATTRVGATVSLQADPTRGLHLALSGTWARAAYDATGLLVPYVPPQVGRLDVTWERPLGRLWNKSLVLTLALGATALGPRPLPFSQRAEGVFVLDLGASVRLGRVEVALSARNLTDSRWRDGVFFYASNFVAGSTGSLVPTEHFTAGRPLTLLSTLTVHL